MARRRVHRVGAPRGRPRQAPGVDGPRAPRAAGPPPLDARDRRRARALPPLRLRRPEGRAALHGARERRGRGPVLERLTANQRSWMSAVASATGGSTFELDGAVCVYQPLPHGELLVPFPERPPGAGVIARARELGARRIGVWAADRALDLSQLGFSAGWEPHWMVSPAMAAPPDARVDEATEVPEYDDYGQRLLALVGRGSHLFVAREDGRFAGHAWLHCAAGVGGLFDVFVPEELRRRGLGAALSRAAIAKAAALGVDDVTLNAEFEPLYESLGFRSLGHGHTWWRHGV